MISPSTLVFTTTATDSITHKSYSSDSAAAVHSPAVDKCGRIEGAAISMAPAETSPGQRDIQIALSSQPTSSHDQLMQHQEQKDLHSNSLQQASAQPLTVEDQQPTDSADGSWDPGQAQSSGENVDVADYEEETWDPNGPPPQYCTNCTARLYAPECSDCGHSSEHDDSLFGHGSGTAKAEGLPVTQQHQRCPFIIWDDEMLLHEEGKAVPHPERPDRLRAIMSRLVGNGLAGKLRSIYQ